jgi:hypothetical protein
MSASAAPILSFIRRLPWLEQRPGMIGLQITTAARGTSLEQNQSESLTRRLSRNVRHDI